MQGREPKEVDGVAASCYPKGVRTLIVFFLLAAWSSSARAALPVISSLQASPQPATAGQPVTLSWTLSGADRWTLEGRDVTGESAQTLAAPEVPTDYTLTATNGEGSAARRLRIEVVPAALPLAAVRLNEVVAWNASGLRDETGLLQDWLELYNPGTSPVDLGGWHLSDDRQLPAKWTFPAVAIPAQGYLVVFASGQNRAVAGQALHANFKLNKGGGSLALCNPQLQEVSALPNLPKLASDQAYGPGLGNTRTPRSLSAANVQWLVPGGPVASAWQGGAAFDDATWNRGTWALGFGSIASTAYQIPQATVGTQSFAGALGMDFDVLRPVQVTELGCFDSGADGLSRSITVVLWTRNPNGTPASTADDLAGAVRSSLVFTAAAPGTLVGGQRFKTLASPLSLLPGSYTIAAYNYGATEPNGNSLAFNGGTQDGGGALRFVGSSRYGVTAPPPSVAASWPGTPDGGPAAQYAAGTFRFREAATYSTNTEAAMRPANASVLTRTAFDAPLLPFHPVLQVTADDGFVAWINGVEVARHNAPVDLAWNAAAPAADLLQRDIPLDAFSSAFAASNILAIQGLNCAADDPDFQLRATLSGEAAGELIGFLDRATPGAANGAARWANGPVINEIHSDPTDSKSRFTEFVEIYNPLTTPVDVGQWSLGGGLAYQIPPGTVIAPNGYLVIGENPAHLATGLSYAGALGPWTGSLGNGGDEVLLRDAALAVVDRVAYGLGFPWPTVGDDPGNSLQRLREGLDGSLGGSWRSAVPTPGARNRLTTGLVPPAIRQVEHAPRAPSSGQAVTITAKITDPEGVAAVWLEYQIVAPGTYVRLTDTSWAANWTTLPMRDDGLNGDAVARDEVFSAVVPASAQQHRRLIRYRLRAWDGALTAVRVPYEDDACPNFAYFCYDGVPAWTSALRPGVTAKETFSAATMNKVRPWHLLSNPADVQNCQYSSSYNDGTFRFEGALVIGDEVYDHIHYRIKGQNSTFNTGKNKWKIKFNRGHLLELPDDYGRHRTAVETLNISSVPAPWAPWNRGLNGLDEAMAFRLSALAGVPAPRTSYLQLRVIDQASEQSPTNQYEGDFWGLYLAFENLDNQFKEEHRLPDGNLFRLMGNETGNRLLGQGRGQASDLSDLNAFVSTTAGYRRGGGSATTAPALNAIQPEAWFRTNVNLEEYYSWRSVTEAINQTDRREQENVVYFRDPADGRWQILPWDCDLLYENFDRWGPKSVQTAVDLQQYEQIARGLLHPAILTEFQNRARELQDLLLNREQAGKVVDEFVSIITDETPRVIADGSAIADGLVEAERRRWDYNPLNPTPPRGAGPTGNYYKTPYPIGNMTNGPFPQPYSRVLASGDFEGMVKWVKDFIATGPNGGSRLGKMSQGLVLPYTLAVGPAIALPTTPVITYRGPAGYPLNQLQFSSSAFSSSSGQAFKAQQWRLGEIYDPSVPGFAAGQPWRYEISDLWNPAPAPAFGETAAPPATGLTAGHTYRARVRHQDSAGRWSHWSDPVQFQAGAPVLGDLAGTLAISEIMYNPPGPEGGDAEFVELLNLHPSAALDLSGVEFTEGITFRFAEGTVLAAGARILVVKNAAAFAAKYGSGLPVAGEYQANAQNALANGGERLVLSLGAGLPLQDFAYGAFAPWPSAADNGGQSLALAAPSAAADPSLPESWRAGPPTPGADSGGSYALWKQANAPGPEAADPDGDGLNAFLEYAFGTSPTSPSPGTQPQLGRRADGSLHLTCRRRRGVDDLALALERSTDLQHWQPAPSTLAARREEAEVEFLEFQLAPETAAGPTFYRVRYTAQP